MKKSPNISKEMLISEIVEKYPETISLFLNWGLHCVGCSFAKEETIEEATRVHQIDLGKLISDLNKAIRK